MSAFWINRIADAMNWGPSWAPF